ncbi:AB hydrolase superfamily protein C4A8.06c [Golovinomyces cichoracearum]|uniref:AB hydrolase superfamily protein C4A8.06c n=1 Tax=Golovinomyces cichoracearum TaxID=62708 RepID=A0A420IK64_9PEZI|nr:AB hydrolase superfamily protein C4A8.06c [Golovinomyces cichoracearum]
MVLNTVTVVGAVTPALISTLIFHFISRKSKAGKPTSHLSYDEGLALVRKFLAYASQNTVEDVQRFTTQKIPHSIWAKVDPIIIPDHNLALAAGLIQNQLGENGIDMVGGKNWWQWRIPGSNLSAEWFEMYNLYKKRKEGKYNRNRIMFYVHGGAYYFGSVDEHRYQIQRHAQKLEARVFAPKYRLAPQFPFPCGLYDCLAAYMYLISVQDPNTIVMAGDSAGGGMILSMMIIMRDQGIPLPAGAILISPWVDLTHSFPSVAIQSPLDYLLPCGFHHKPSEAWPPPTPFHSPNNVQTAESIEGIKLKRNLERISLNKKKSKHNSYESDLSTKSKPTDDDVNEEQITMVSPATSATRRPGNDFSIILKEERVNVLDQIHMYTPNHMLMNPLVSPVMQPSLGGLPPLLVLTGGAELLRDEQIYLAHKAANPKRYPPGDHVLDESGRAKISHWGPTFVQLQVWEDFCHVAPLLSFTPPAKHMYRSMAQFGSWALSRAQELKTSEERNKKFTSYDENMLPNSNEGHTSSDGKAGDTFPPFQDHMIRQKIDFRGNITNLKPESELAACNMDPSEIGVAKEGPLLSWFKAKQEWDIKFASVKLRVQRERANKVPTGYRAYEDGEDPPPSALVRRWMMKIPKKL